MKLDVGGDFIFRQLKGIVSWVLPIVIGVVVALGVKTYVAEPAIVPSSSMYPTIPGVSDRNFALILADRLATEFGQKIYRGEVVVFRFPDNPSKLFVKRVVGLPGDTVQVTENAVYINGKELNESNPDIAKSNGTAVGTFKVPQGHYFMLGDNRPVSDDSRLWKNKYVARSAIIGKANFVLYPITKMGSISQSLAKSGK